MTGRWVVRDGTFGVAVVSIVDHALITLSPDPVPALRPYGLRSGWSMAPCNLRMTAAVAAELHRVLGEALNKLKEIS